MRLRSLLLLPVLVLTACYPQVPMTPVEEVQNGKELTAQELSWADCESGFECATLAVPLDWLNQDGQYLGIRLTRKSGYDLLPPLLVNPGGPGASGVSFVQDNYGGIGTSNLRKNFQLIGFDPRGVGLSEPVTCLDVELKDQLYYGQSPYDFGSPQDIAWSKGLVERFAKSCQTVGFDLAYFNTQQTARDMDLIRQVLGMEQLDYLGYSYGTELGAVYTALFPDRVGKFVLDGAVDPTLSAGDTLLNQVVGFDDAFDAYLEDCLSQEGCPFSGDLTSAKAQVSKFLLGLESATLPTDFDRDLGVTAAIYGIIAALYSQDSWVYLTQALDEALNGDGTTMMMLADFYNDREPSGGYLSNINEANTAISCADSRVTDAEAGALHEQIMESSELFGKYFSYPELSCVGWPEGKGLVELSFTGMLSSGPLVIGTTGDPATPYIQAVALSQMLDGARLLTFVGEGHTAYGSNDCVNQYVEEYLAGTALPESELKCQ